MPHSLGKYIVTHRNQSVEVELEDMEVYNAASSPYLKRKLAAAVRDALRIKWVEYDDLEFARIGDSSVPSGCTCECRGCNDTGYHCRSKARECYI